MSTALVLRKNVSLNKCNILLAILFQLFIRAIYLFFFIERTTSNSKPAKVCEFTQWQSNCVRLERWYEDMAGF